jgi:hypothetical protein
LTARGVRAICLIKNDGIADLIHENVLKYKIGSRAKGWKSPCFDSHSISSAAKGAVFYEDSVDIISFFLPRLPMLIPCPGRQKTFEIWTSLVPDSMAIQSSPVPIVELEILMP